MIFVVKVSRKSFKNQIMQLCNRFMFEDIWFGRRWMSEDNRDGHGKAKTSDAQFLPSHHLTSNDQRHPEKPPQKTSLLGMVNMPWQLCWVLFNQSGLAIAMTVIRLLFGCLCNSVPGRHSDLFWQSRATYRTCQRSSAITLKAWLVCQSLEVWVPFHLNRVSGLHPDPWQSVHGTRKSQYYPLLANSKEC